MPLLTDLFWNKSGSNRQPEWKAGRNLVLDKNSYLLRAAQTARPDHPRLNVAKSSATARRSCGNILCESAWTLPWKSREHPLFEGKWACSTQCLSAMVQAAVAREAVDGRRDLIEEQHNHRIPLGLVLLAQGWITHPQLQKALESQRASGSGRIGEWLVSECGLESETVTRGLSVQWGCPVLTTDGFTPQTMAMALPRVFIEEYGILPLRIAGTKVLYVGFKDRIDASSAFAVEQMSGLKAESGLVSEERFREARERLLACDFAAVTHSAAPTRDTLANSIAAVIDRTQPTASKLVRLHRYYWLRTWHQKSSHRAMGSVPSTSKHANDFLFTVGKRPQRAALQPRESIAV